MPTISFRVGVRKFHLKKNDLVAYSEWKDIVMQDWRQSSKNFSKHTVDVNSAYEKFVDMVLLKSFENPEQVAKLSKRHKAILFLKLVDHYEKKAS